VGAQNDAIFLVRHVKATAHAHGTRAEIFPDAAQDMMLEDGGRAVADRILRCLGERNL